MKPEQIHDALNHISDDLLEETDALRRQKHRARWRIWLPLAACLALVVALGIWGFGSRGPVGLPQGTDATEQALQKQEGPTQTEAHQGIDIGTWLQGLVLQKPEPVKAKPGFLLDMSAFFIYQGRQYDEALNAGDRSLLGDFLGTATGGINEWTEQGEYADFSGSIAGDFYTVEGYDPEFMLCMTQWMEGLRIYINIYDRPWNEGSELYRDLLGLDDTLAQMSFETRDSWDYGKNQIYTLPEEAQAAWPAFLEAMNQGTFVSSRDDIPLPEGEPNIYTAYEQYHLYLTKADGLTVHLRLFEGGYVMLNGMYGACVQMEEGAYNAFVQLLNQ